LFPPQRRAHPSAFVFAAAVFVAAKALPQAATSTSSAAHWAGETTGDATTTVHPPPSDERVYDYDGCDADDRDDRARGDARCLHPTPRTRNAKSIAIRIEMTGSAMKGMEGNADNATRIVVASSI
jgi:hypothetical protein